MQIRVLPIDELTPTDLDTWSELQRADAQLHNPYLRPEFAVLAGQVSHTTEVAVLQEDGRTVGFFPFERDAGGIGRPVGDPISDMHALIARPELRWDVPVLMRKCNLVAWTFDHLLASQASFAPYHESLDGSACMDLSHGFQAYCDERRRAGSSVIQRADQRKRQLEREVGPVRCEWHTADPSVLAAVCKWKQDQIRHVHYPDIFQLPQVDELLRRIASVQSEKFAGLVSALYAGDHLVAAQFGVSSYEVLSASIPAFDPQFAKYSPGMILHVELARQSEARGVTRIDLGRGENQTKKSLTSNSVQVALGAVDLRPLPALLRKAWFRMRDVVYATPLRKAPLNWYRRLRNRLLRPTV